MKVQPSKSGKPDLPPANEIPPVEESPVLPVMLEHMDVDLGVTQDGRFFIFHEKPYPEEIDYVIYNTESSKFCLVSINGRMQDVGMKMHEKLKKKMEYVEQVYLVHVEADKAKAIVEVQLVIEGAY